MTLHMALLDFDPGDVLVLRTAQILEMDDAKIISDLFAEAFGVSVIFIDKSFDMEKLSADRVQAVKDLWANPDFKKALRHLASVVTPIERHDRRMVCYVITGDDENNVGHPIRCGQYLDDDGDCPNHGHDVPYSFTL